MKNKFGMSGIVLGVLMFVFGHAMAQETRPAEGAEVTLKGVMMCNVSCVKRAAKGDETQVVLFAMTGTPEVDATFDSIMKENWKGQSIDGDQARKIQDEFENRLKYYITPGPFTTKKDLPRWSNPARAVTGVVSEKDGKKWITPSKIEGVKLKFPDKMLAPDKPFAMAGAKPLVLKISETLSLNCILLPAGKFFAGVPFYATYDDDKQNAVRYDDDYPAMLTLTKPFYMAEIPVTQEMYEAVMGNNPADQKGAQIPVTRMSATDIGKFCQALSEKNNRMVRLPTQAEWEYAARVGTSGPAFNQKYLDQLNSALGGGGFLPVKSKKPNAWGLYDMVCDASWEMIRDARQFSRQDQVDPYYPDKKSEKNHNAMGRTGFSDVCTREGVSDGTGTGYTLTRFRVAVEATPQEIEEMKKAAGK